MIRDHVFIPGDLANGWERECSVRAPVREAGRWVTAHCGYPPEEHQATTDPIHTETCVARIEGEGCDCWVSKPATPPGPAKMGGKP